MRNFGDQRYGNEWQQISGSSLRKIYSTECTHMTSIRQVNHYNEEK